MSSWGWLAEAACAQIGPFDLLWFGSDDDSDGDERNGPGQARRVCAACPVREECLEVAVREDHWGVWGGTTRAERRRMHLNAQRAATRKSRAA